MWQKLKEQIPSIVILAVLVVSGVAFTLNRIDSRHREELAALQTQNKSMHDQAEENGRQFAATNKLLQDALKRNTSSFLSPEQSVEMFGDKHLNHLADLIAKRIEPKLPEVQTPAEMERMERAETNRIATRLTNNLRPVLVDSAAKHDAAQAALRADEQRIAQLSGTVRDTQAAAQDAVRLSHELSALYLDSFKDHGVVVRLLSLPAELIQDTAKLNLVTGRDRRQVDRELSAKMSEIEKRLSDLRAGASKS